jgi:hypothetical protein
MCHVCETRFDAKVFHAMAKQRPYSEWTPLGAGFNVILGDDGMSAA